MPPAPSAPGDLVYTITSSTSLTIEWKPPQRPNGPINNFTISLFPTDGSSSDSVLYFTRNTTIAVDLFDVCHKLNYRKTVFNISVFGVNVDENGDHIEGAEATSRTSEAMCAIKTGGKIKDNHKKLPVP